MATTVLGPTNHGLRDTTARTQSPHAGYATGFEVRPEHQRRKATELHDDVGHWALLASQSDFGFCFGIRLPTGIPGYNGTTVSEGCGGAPPGSREWWQPPTERLGFRHGTRPGTPGPGGGPWTGANQPRKPHMGAARQAMAVAAKPPGRAGPHRLPAHDRRPGQPEHGRTLRPPAPRSRHAL
jgi:hypothetical protein